MMNNLKTPAPIIRNGAGVYSSGSKNRIPLTHMDLNDFYYEKIISRDAEDNAETYAGGLFEEGRDKYMAQYASLWCFMAMTRAIDTLYIKLSNTSNSFSQ